MSDVKCSCGKIIYKQSSGKWFMWLSYGVSLEVNYCHSCGDQLNPDSTVIPCHEIKRKAEAMDYRAFVLIDNKYIEIELAPNGIKPPQCKTYWRFSREVTP